mmetsp:Transcript_202/g.351  ORF Transcript_202/g.351 Transcript_202/m.351 type:complete len:350 (+) Transcript_202:213-1262(+)
MPLSSSEALRLARECIPKMRENKHIPAEFDHNLCEKDVEVKSVCRLWAGMGYIYDVSIRGGFHIIVKHIVPPPEQSRSFGDVRKARSYEVEANFYRHVAPILIAENNLSIPVPYHVENDSDTSITICMSRLDGSPGYLSDDDQIQTALKWMATLHAANWGKADQLVEEKGLQPIGSYWHLDTRPSEHDSMPRRGWEGRLKRAARAIDERLKRDPMQTVIHGDLKDANMLFSNNSVGIYDFQYCGRAPPTVDLAYFFCVVVGDADDAYLEFYHKQLSTLLGTRSCNPPTIEHLKESLAIAFCDFQRFMSGWGNWGSDISQHVIKVLNRLDGGTILPTEDAYREAMLEHFG